MLLNYPLKGYELSDDVESFFHLLCLSAFRFHSHSEMDEEKLGHTLQGMYDHAQIKNGYWVGSSTKLNMMRHGTLPANLNTNCNPGLSGLLDALMRVCHEHYSSLDYSHYAQFAVGDPPVTAPPPQPQPSEPHFNPDILLLYPSESELPPVPPPWNPRIQPTGASRKLDSHAAFKGELVAFIKDRNIWNPELKPGEQDKLDVDLFARIKWQSIKPTAGKSSKLSVEPSRSVTGSGRKRTKSHADALSGFSLEPIEEQPPPAKRSKKSGSRSAAATQAAGPGPTTRSRTLQSRTAASASSSRQSASR